MITSTRLLPPNVGLPSNERSQTVALNCGITSDEANAKRNFIKSK